MEDGKFDIGRVAELETPVGLYGAVHQVEVAGDLIFNIVIGVVVSEPPMPGG